MEVVGQPGLWLGAAGRAGAPQGTMHSPAKAPWEGVGCLFLWGIRKGDQLHIRGKQP